MEKHYAIKRTGSNNELTHWKYIKKVKKNGKWKYYYDKESLKNDVKDKLGYDEAERLEELDNKLVEAKKASEKARDEFNKKADAYYQNSITKEQFDEAESKKNKVYEEEDKILEARIKAHDEFMSTPIGKLSVINKKIQKFIDKFLYDNDWKVTEESKVHYKIR